MDNEVNVEYEPTIINLKNFKNGTAKVVRHRPDIKFIITREDKDTLKLWEYNGD